ncbi:hypothetical protein [Novosphingobium humi]|uniref:Uncharacterized protein n=1 Tax=Novosphingobium humi TaxID=2282397 RepID=A0ABY7U1G2_9SPHN|nr:hypothetical protein [Novosphingobium humi]WCT79073.1 hypothetical protein PQ457_18850 [Novosphingobium humi]
MRFNNLGRYKTGGTSSRMQLSVPAPKTPSGRVYRYSPNEKAPPRHFILGDVVADIPLTTELRHRMKLEPRSNQTVCPYSGVIDDDSTFLHPDDLDAAIETVKQAALVDVHRELDRMLGGLAKSFAGNSFVKMEVKSSVGPPPKPHFRRSDLMRELICDHCGRDYGVYAIGLFCPDCGAPNLRLHFLRETQLVIDQIEIAEQLDAEQEELAYRLLGNAHEDVLTAFEATLKAVYLYGIDQLGKDRPRVGNDFQNVDKATKRFAEIVVEPFATLTPAAMDVLKINIQKRHVIGHNLGVIDDKFVPFDPDAKVGETVAIIGDDIRQFAAVGQQVIDALDAWLCGTMSPMVGNDAALAIKPLPARPDDPDNLSALSLDLSLLARKMALWIAQTSPNGLSEFVDCEELVQHFCDTKLEELVEAVAELKQDGFVETYETMGRDIPYCRPTADLFLIFDAKAIGANSSADIAHLIPIILDGPDAVDVATLFAKCEWEKRRFNPALSAIIAHIPEGRVIGAADGEFAAHYFQILPEDRVSLKRYWQRIA